MTTSGKIRVLVVDDSAAVREALVALISDHPEMEVMATAEDPFEAAECIRREVPDVITLDIEMPRMDGITFLRRLMAQRPIPVIVCSTLVTNGSKAMFSALEAGAVDLVTKPNFRAKQFLEESAIMIQDKILGAAAAKFTGKQTAAAIAPRPVAQSGRALATGQKIVAIGASTGGPEALRVLLGALPADAPPIVVVQHMPAQFTAALADGLNRECAVTVREAQDGQRLEAGVTLIAPGNRHTLIVPSGGGFAVKVEDGPLVSRHRPSVDMLFDSVAQNIKRRAVGVLLTGMGSDGAKGLKNMRDAGALTIGQNEATCVVYGMSRAARELGGVTDELPLSQIPAAMLERGRSVAA